MIQNLVRTEHQKNIHSSIQCVPVWVLLPRAAAPLANAPTASPAKLLIYNAAMNLQVLYKLGSSITS